MAAHDHDCASIDAYCCQPCPVYILCCPFHRYYSGNTKKKESLARLPRHLPGLMVRGSFCLSYTRYGKQDRHDNLCSWPELTQYCVHGTPPCVQVTSSPISHWNAQRSIQENPNTIKLSLHNSIIQGKPPASVKKQPLRSLSPRYLMACI